MTNQPIGPISQNANGVGSVSQSGSNRAVTLTEVATCGVQVGDNNTTHNHIASIPLFFLTKCGQVINLNYVAAIESVKRADRTIVIFHLQAGSKIESAHDTPESASVELMAAYNSIRQVVWCAQKTLDVAKAYDRTPSDRS